MGEKPISIILYEFKTDIINIINNTQLSPCVIEPIIKNIYEEIVKCADEQLKQDQLNYNIKTQNIEVKEERFTSKEEPEFLTKIKEQQKEEVEK